MKRLILIIIAMFCCLNAMASEYDDLLFAAGLYGDGNLDLAQIELEKYIIDNPESKYLGEAKYLLASILLEKEDFPQAEDFFETLIKNPPSSLIYNELVLNLAAAYFGNDKHDKVISLLEKEKINAPEDRKAKSLYLLGSSYYAKGEVQKASESLEKAIIIDKSKDTYKQLIVVYIETQQILEAKKLIDEMIKLYPNENATDFVLLEYYKYNMDIENYQAIYNTGYGFIKHDSPYFEQFSLIAAFAAFETQQYEESLKHLENLNSDEASYYQALNLIKLEDSLNAKTILEKVYENSSGKLKANALFYLAMLEEDISQKLQLYKNFIDSNTTSEFIQEAYYQAGISAFNLADYSSAKSYLNKAINSDLPEKLAENAEFLLIETCYLEGNFQQVIDKAASFLQKFTTSEYLPELHFKKGLSYFNLKDYTNSEESFKLLIFNYTQSDRIGLCNFYLAEISLLQDKTETARNYYSAALEGTSDKELAWLRIAQSWFKDDNMSKSSAALKNISDNSKYLKEKVLLEGDISFRNGNFDKAISKFDQAAILEEDATHKETITARKAWTFYQMGDYERASEIYKQLSIKTDKPANYTFQSATALFSAQNYQLALDQYKVFAENFTENKNYHAALVGIADCYYNLQNYEEARKQYRKLLIIIDKEKLYENILDGWKWSTEQSGKSFKSELDDFLSGNVPYNFYFLVSAYKVKYLFNIGEYEETLTVIDELLRKYTYPMRELEFIKAKTFKKLGQWQAAEDYYSHLFMEYHAPELQYEWSEVSIQMGKPDTAIRKLQYAVEKTKKEDYIIKLFDLQLKNEHKDFNSDYDKYITHLTGIYKENAEIIRVKWLLNNGKTTEADAIIEKLKASSFKETQAQAQYLKGLSFYTQSSYNLAVPELLRVRHLFPFLIEVRQQAEELAFRAYLKMNKIDEARNLLDNIKSELSQEKVSELEKLLEDR